jgi:hypothetical protein
MNRTKQLLLLGFTWLAAVTALHLRLNFDWDAFLNGYRPVAERKLTVAYIPVT